ncbi:signal recognition particle subunit Srp68p [[Candida] jaroonii]|uniref:Signal recognition particle subunit Srp68p n=1 Tax=[Candida] jaroonii TaxID=467808 RepID=A0ACA9Y2G3_9ASCO|nr:signal recognition particle subunit Srp68p [[Candida] jaroonii]
MDSPLALTIGNRITAYLNSAEDYHKYRKRINKQLLRLRHDLDLVTRDTKNYKTKEKFSKISIEDYENDERFGLILLLTSERDLLYSLEIRSLLEISNEGNASSYKNLMISKLKRSIIGTKKLLEVVKNEQDKFKLLEIYIYAAINEGSLAIHKRKWSKALNSFSMARCGLELLHDERAETETFNKSIISELINTVVDPSINLSVNQLNLNLIDLKSISRKHCRDNELPYLSPIVELISSIDDKYVKEISSTVDKIESVNWRDHEARIYNDEISFKLIKLVDSNNNNLTEIENFDELITGWNEILELHQIDVSKNQDEEDDEKIQDRAILLTFINYNLLFTTIRRDLILIDDLSTKSLKVSKNKKLIINKDITRLYTSIISTLDEIKELPGVFNDEDLSNSLENMIKYYNYKKSVKLAECFTLNGKHIESLKVLDVIYKDCQDKEELYSVEDFPFDVTNNKEFIEFKTELQQLLNKNHIMAQFYYETNNDSVIIENMNKFPLNNNILGFNNILPVLPKPVLFDIGYNYINYSGTNSNSGTPEPSTSTDDDNKKKGFFGIFGRS